MRKLVLPAHASPREWGRIHGECFRGEIHSLSEIRTYLTMKLGKFPDRDTVLRVAAAHLPVLERCDRDLYEELCGIAEGSGASPAQIVVLNHYTDLRDLDPATALAGPSAAGAEAGEAGAEAGAEPGDEPGGCSIVWARAPSGPILAQTWDMHATAIPYVMMLYVPERAGRPASWLFTLTGCLGMTGLNRHGLGVAINNLFSTDARIGVVWPALVRRCLYERSAARARDVVLQSPIGSGRHYMAADAVAAWGIEASGTMTDVIFDAGTLAADAGSYIHTNHCLSPNVGANSRVPPTSTTYDRYQRLTASVAERAVADVPDVWRRLGSQDGYPRSVCTNMATPENPHGTATCGAIAMELVARRAWAQSGFIHNVDPELFDFPETA
jgi:isopenicillin-N N-acyltransferase-like protein